jgi:hypothetical protein
MVFWVALLLRKIASDDACMAHRLAHTTENPPISGGMITPMMMLSTSCSRITASADDDERAAINVTNMIRPDKARRPNFLADSACACIVGVRGLSGRGTCSGMVAYRNVRVAIADGAGFGTVATCLAFGHLRDSHTRGMASPPGTGHRLQLPFSGLAA